MPEEPIQIRIEPPAPKIATRRQRPRRGTWIILASAACTLLAAIAVFAWNGRVSKSKDVTNANATPKQAPSATKTVTAPPPTAAEQIVDDPKGEFLWASPTAGEPLSLAYIPSGVQCLVHLRPALLTAHPDGERALAAFGPWGQAKLAKLKAALPTELSQVESLLVAIVVGPNGELDASLRAELATSLSDDALHNLFPSSKAQRHGEHSLRIVDDRAYFVAPTDAKTLVVCPMDLAGELMDSAGEPPPLVRDLESLVEQTDADRTAAVIVALKFLDASGSDLLTAEAAPLRDALHQLLGSEATAIALSADWGDDFFVELRAEPALNVPPRRLAAKLRQQIAAAPNAIEETILASPWHPYGRKVLARFPGMLRALARYSRAAEDNRQAVVRAYLPPTAGHNLLMAAELLLTQPREREASTAAAPVMAANPATLEDRLEKVTSLTFPKESLEGALELLAEDVGVEIVIQGADLQLDGITKNQSLSLDLRDRPVREILLEILLKANPDRTATSPADARQKLVYVAESAPAGGPGRIIVTTRTAAAKRGDKLPAVFRPEER